MNNMVMFGLTLQEMLALFFFVGTMVGVYVKFNVNFAGHTKDIKALQESLDEIKGLINILTKVNTKIVEHDKDITSLQNELTEHKGDNKDSFIKIETLFVENTKNNRDDHNKIFDKFDMVSDQLTNATRIFLKNPNI